KAWAAKEEIKFSLSNPSEVLVTSADSLVRILDGAKLVQKYKASYSPDGKYIINASEDSQVHIWSSLDVNQASVSASADPDTEKATDEQQQVVKQARAAEERERAAKERQQATEDRQHALLKRVKELEEQVKESANMSNPMDMATTSVQYRLINPQRFAADYNHSATYTSVDCVSASAHMTAMCANHTAFMEP
ncbi:WD repeat-containing protein 44, partial [Tanacetum coccineum]